MIEQEWWKNKLAEDIYATLKAKEQSLPPYRAQSPQLWIRRHLVDWLAVIAGELRICKTAQHLGIYLLDYFMDSVEVEQSQIHLVAIVCLQIAIKFEDYCDRIPHFSRLNGYLPNSDQPYRGREYLAMELTVLKLIDWDLCVPTVAHFLPYFLQVAVDEDDLRDGMPIPSKAVVKAYLEKHAMYFLEICLQDHTFRDFSPSLIAAACIASARICLHLTPTWPKQMELMTDYYLEELLPCIQNMLGTHQQDGLQQNLQSAMISPYPSPDCVPCGISPDTYYQSVTPSFGNIYSVPNVQLPCNGCETFPRDSYQSDFKSDSLPMRNYYQSTMACKSYAPHQNMVHNLQNTVHNFQNIVQTNQTVVQKHPYRTAQPVIYSTVISYASPSATQMGQRLLPGCRGS